MTDPDPRVFFAAERTLLAWLRTGLTVMALGFVVARFGLFLRLLQPQSASAESHAGASGALGVLFVVVGAITILAATVQHRRFISTLPHSDLPPSYNRALALVLCSVVGVLGLLLGVYLVISHP